MDVQPAPRCRSVWADLDALVLEEVDALRAGPDRPPEAPAFATEDEFVARASAYLRGHHDPEALVERLCADLGLFRPPQEEAPAPAPATAAAAATAEEPPDAVPDQEESAPPAEGGGEPER